MSDLAIDRALAGASAGAVRGAAAAGVRVASGPLGWALIVLEPTSTSICATPWPPGTPEHADCRRQVLASRARRLAEGKLSISEQIAIAMETAEESAPSCPAEAVFDPCAHLAVGEGDGTFRGGSFDKVGKRKAQDQAFIPPDQRRPTERHHIPTAKALRGAGLDPDKGAVVLIDREDHRALPSSQGKHLTKMTQKQIELVREGKFLEAFDLGVEELKQRLDDVGQSDKYDKALEEARAYWECREENGFPGSSSEK